MVYKTFLNNFEINHFYLKRGYFCLLSHGIVRCLIPWVISINKLWRKYPWFYKVNKLCPLNTRIEERRRVGYLSWSSLPALLVSQVKDGGPQPQLCNLSPDELSVLWMNNTQPHQGVLIHPHQAATWNKSFIETSCDQIKTKIQYKGG